MGVETSLSSCLKFFWLYMYMLDCLTIAVLLLIFEDPPCLFFTELVPFSIPARAWI